MSHKITSRTFFYLSSMFQCNYLYTASVWFNFIANVSNELNFPVYMKYANKNLKKNHNKVFE